MIKLVHEFRSWLAVEFISIAMSIMPWPEKGDLAETINPFLERELERIKL